MAYIRIKILFYLPPKILLLSLIKLVMTVRFFFAYTYRKLLERTIHVEGVFIR